MFVLILIIGELSNKCFITAQQYWLFCKKSKKVKTADSDVCQKNSAIYDLFSVSKLLLIFNVQTDFPVTWNCNLQAQYFWKPLLAMQATLVFFSMCYEYFLSEQAMHCWLIQPILSLPNQVYLLLNVFTHCLQNYH